MCVTSDTTIASAAGLSVRSLLMDGMYVRVRTRAAGGTAGGMICMWRPLIACPRKHISIPFLTFSTAICTAASAILSKVVL